LFLQNGFTEMVRRLICQFSRVTFNDDGSGALFAVSKKQDGEKSESIDFVFANKVDDHWTFLLMC